MLAILSCGVVLVLVAILRFVCFLNYACNVSGGGVCAYKCSAHGVQKRASELEFQAVVTSLT